MLYSIPHSVVVTGSRGAIPGRAVVERQGCSGLDSVPQVVLGKASYAVDGSADVVPLDAIVSPGAQVRAVCKPQHCGKEHTLLQYAGAHLGPDVFP